MATVTVTIPNTDWDVFQMTRIRWTPSNSGYINLGATLAAVHNTNLYFAFLTLASFNGMVDLYLSDGSSDHSLELGPEFSTQMEDHGTITLVASNGDSLVLTGISDSSEPYIWIPSNAAAVMTFAGTLIGLSDRSLTVTFYDGMDVPPVLTTPTFADDMGDAQSWTQDTTITSIVVPEATGNPPPTYAVVGSLPAGIGYHTGSRTIFGAPQAIGSGTITIRATNSEGIADWTVTYTTGLPSWISGGAGSPTDPYIIADPLNVNDRSILDVMLPGRGTVSSATGRARATHFRFTPPAGYSGQWGVELDTTPTSVDMDLAEADGTPSSVTDTGDEDYSQTLTMGAPYTFLVLYFSSAANSQSSVTGVTALTITLSPPQPSVAPVFADDTGNAQSWTQNTAITSITAPEAAVASGTPAPAYAAVGSLPAGISFNTSTRVISGTPTAVGSGTIRIRATNSEGTADWTVTYTTAAAPPADVAPSFTDDTGNAQSWTQNTAITPITVPAASGTPTPTYAAVGSLPAGISFNASTRVISGTPTAVGSGTIRIRATNSEGTADWTVTYTTVAAVGPVTVNLTGAVLVASVIVRWADDVSLGTVFAADGGAQVLEDTRVHGTGSNNSGRVELHIAGSNDRFTIAFETSGRIIFEASDGETLEVMIANADMAEPYQWTPTNSAEVIAFADHVIGLVDRDATLTLTDEPPPDTAPVFADDTGSAQAWTQNTAITSIAVPAASGTPAPSYAAVGSLPAGINFNTGTRVISGTPTAVGSGTIRIRATNSEGTADWTVTYTTAAAPPADVAPSFTDDTGSAQAWTQNTAITPITVPAAAGNPSPAYASVGSLPTGIAFNTGTRVISGTPTSIGNGTIRIRATNSEGSDDWTVTYVTTAAPPVLTAPSFTDDTGDAQSWTQNTAITSLTVPEADGTPAPTYAAVGSLPAGIAFNIGTRVISGTPTAVGSGTITIRASNTEGSDDWTVAYTTTADVQPTAAPVFADDTGNAQSWTVGSAISSIRVPAASGNPTPTYAVVGSLPSGLAFSANTRRLTGTPTSTGNGTIRIRATNSEGTADWTVTYVTTAAPPTAWVNPYTWFVGKQASPMATLMNGIRDAMDYRKGKAGEVEIEDGLHAASLSASSGNAWRLTPMTIQERAEIFGSPPGFDHDGIIIYNSSTNKVQGVRSGVWVDLGA